MLVTKPSSSERAANGLKCFTTFIIFFKEKNVLKTIFWFVKELVLENNNCRSP